MDNKKEKYLNNYGYIWKKQWIRPYESFWGILQRFMHVNVLTRTEILQLLNIRYSPDVKYHSQTACYIRGGFPTQTDCCIRGYTKSISLKCLDIEEDHFSDMEIFSSLSTKQASCFMQKHLIYCPICMEKHGFHSYYHQIAGMKKCPWHPHISLVTDPDRLYLVKTGSEDYAYGYTDPAKITEKSPCFTMDKLPEPILPKFPYKHVYLCGGQESIGQLNNLDFLNLKDFKNIAGSTEDLERKYRNLFPLVDKYLEKIYACKFRYSKENLWCIVLFLLIKRKLSIYSEQEIRNHLAQITIRRSDNFNPELAATLMFAKDIFQISEIAQALSPYVFTIFTGKTKTYKPENIPVYIGDLFELPIHIYINYRKSKDYISACLLADAFNYLFEEYKAVLRNKKTQITYPVYIIVEEKNGTIKYSRI